MIKNIMTVDLEDYYCDLPFSSWNKYESRILEAMRPVLDLFEKYGVRATFFTLGYIAERHPELIEEIVSRGHEIASHGYSHGKLSYMSRDDFESDLVKSLEILRRISGTNVRGFRAPFFSINRNNLWAFEVMRKQRVLYDSSIFPVKLHYGLPEAPRFIYRISEEDPLRESDTSNFVELPMTTLRLPVLGNIPVAGGIYMRFLPYQLVKIGIKKFNNLGYPAIFYIHCNDLDPSMPRIPEYAWYYYWGLDGAMKKFESLLKDFNFSSIDEVIEL